MKQFIKCMEFKYIGKQFNLGHKVALKSFAVQYEVTHLLYSLFQKKIYPPSWFAMPDTQKHCWKGAMIVVWLRTGYGISKLFPD